MVLNDDRIIRISCNYKAESGKWTKFTRCVTKSNYSCCQDLSAAVETVVKTVSKFYEDNHCQPDETSDDDSPA